MQPQPIRDAHRRRPFRPIVIHTTAGESYHVPQPEMMAQSPAGNIVMVASGASVAMIDVSDITEITFDGLTPRDEEKLNRILDALQGLFEDADRPQPGRQRPGTYSDDHPLHLARKLL